MSVFQSERQTIYLKYLEKLLDERIAFLDKKSGMTLFDIRRFAEQYTDVIEKDDLLIGKLKLAIERRLVAGQQFFSLMRSNKTVLYHLASVVDDANFGVTHVVRGQDKLSIADLQEAVKMALGFKVKKYLHTPILLGDKGKILTGAVMLDDFIKMGIVPQALLSYLISSGYGDPDALYYSLEEFIDKFDYRRIHRNNGKFDINRLRKTNKRIVRKMTPEDYLRSFFLYLEKNQEKKLREALEDDSKLCRILIAFQRAPTESAEILKSVLQPHYEDPPQQLQGIIEGIFDRYGKEKEITFQKEM